MARVKKCPKGGIQEGERVCQKLRMLENTRYKRM